MNGEDILDNHGIYEDSSFNYLGDVRNNSGRAQVAMIVFCVLLGVTGLALLSDFFQHRLLTQISDLGWWGQVSFRDQMEANQLRQTGVALLLLAVTIAAIVTFLMWFRRAYYNLHQYYPEAARMGEGWAVGAWFVPFLNIFRPVQIMIDIWTGAQDFLVENEQMKVQHLKSYGLVLLWWAAYIISGIVTFIGVMYAASERSVIEQSLIVTKANMFSRMLSMVAIVLLLLIIRQVNNFENQVQNRLV